MAWEAWPSLAHARARPPAPLAQSAGEAAITHNHSQLCCSFTHRHTSMRPPAAGKEGFGWRKSSFVCMRGGGVAWEDEQQGEQSQNQ